MKNGKVTAPQKAKELNAENVIKSVRKTLRDDEYNDIGDTTTDKIGYSIDRINLMEAGMIHIMEYEKITEREWMAYSNEVNNLINLVKGREETHEKLWDLFVRGDHA